MVTNSAIHTYSLRRSAHIRVATAMPSRIIMPPMVGVPDLVMMWLSGPS